MWFRAFLGSGFILFLALFGWLASHKSSEPTILGRYSVAHFALLMGVAALVIVSLLAQATFFYGRLHKVRREIMLVLSSILVSLIMAEVAIRVFDPLGISYFRESSRYQLDLIPDPILVYKHAPGLQRIYQQLVSVSINELGLRDRDLEKKKKGELRILLLGDSVTFGWGVPVETTFGRKLETTLTSKLGFHPVRTVNSGVGGYNTVQEQAFIRTYINVIEQISRLYIRNDIELNEPPFDPWSQLALQGKTPPEVIRILVGKSWLYRLGVFALKYSRPRGLTSLDKNTRGLRESMNALSSIATLCLERNVRFVVFFYPGGRDVLNTKQRIAVKRRSSQ